MEIQVGNQIKFINENLVGEVKLILSKERLIVSCSDGFDREVSIHEILMVVGDNESLYRIDNNFFSKNFIPKSTKIKEVGVLSNYFESVRYQTEGVLEIDLHLEELVEFPGKLEDWQKLLTQMQHVKKCLKAAVEKKVKKIIFIHGVGTGVLKAELINYLATIDYLIISDADNRRYGVGATEIIIRY